MRYLIQQTEQVFVDRRVRQCVFERTDKTDLENFSVADLASLDDRTRGLVIATTTSFKFLQPAGGSKGCSATQWLRTPTGDLRPSNLTCASDRLIRRRRQRHVSVGFGGAKAYQVLIVIFIVPPELLFKLAGGVDHDGRCTYRSHLTWLRPTRRNQSRAIKHKISRIRLSKDSHDVFVTAKSLPRAGIEPATFRSSVCCSPS